uniref:beta-carotene 3-hydroxylase n=1 Tax=Ananas comosus var. bracteatus TaxID=296719 RepID=A0A6V7PXC1_ANACO|nr:unnamed protein product [Ananas comosus var. bracteatus]
MAAAIAATAATSLGASPSFTAARGGGGGGGRVLVLAPLSIRAPPLHRRRRRAWRNDDDDDDVDDEGGGGGKEATSNRSSIEDSEAERRIAERVARKRSERRTYLMAAVMSSLGITSMAVAPCTTASRGKWRWEWSFGRGGAPALWHASLWHMHESHHRPATAPSSSTTSSPSSTPSPPSPSSPSASSTAASSPASASVPVWGLPCSDGLHVRTRRAGPPAFPRGPIANVPYFRRVAAAHQIHHMDKFKGVPYGLFLGPKELEEVGGLEELEKEINRRIKRN